MPAPWRVLVVDDLASNRHALTTILQDGDKATVVGRAGDGQEAIRLVQELQPDVITLDLEMPRMDGFTFLRLLQATRPTPVIVVSTDSRPHSVFQALELGAVDFVVKPGQGGMAALGSLGMELRDKVLAAAEYAKRPLNDPPPVERETTGFRASGIRCVAVAASTGGPPVVQQLLESFTEQPPFTILVAQHMPARFTEALAERLSKRVKMPLRELRQAESITPGHAYICPGGLVTTVHAKGSSVVARLSPVRTERFAPSADALFSSVAEAYGPDAACVVLTGMGNDGSEGSLRIEKAKGRVFVEAPSTAVLPTMPQATLDACSTARSMRKDGLCGYFSNAARALAAQKPAR